MTDRQVDSYIYIMGTILYVVLIIINIGSLGWINSIFYSKCFLLSHSCSTDDFSKILSSVSYFSLYLILISIFVFYRKNLIDYKNRYKEKYNNYKFFSNKRQDTPILSLQYCLSQKKILIPLFLIKSFFVNIFWILGKIYFFNVFYLFLIPLKDEKTKKTLKEKIKTMNYYILFIIFIKMAFFSSIIFSLFKEKKIAYYFSVITPLIFIFSGICMTTGSVAPSFHEFNSFSHKIQDAHLPEFIALFGFYLLPLSLVGIFGGYGHEYWKDNKKIKSISFIILCITFALASHEAKVKMTHAEKTKSTVISSHIK